MASRRNSSRSTETTISGLCRLWRREGEVKAKIFIMFFTVAERLQRTMQHGKCTTFEYVKHVDNGHQCPPKRAKHRRFVNFAISTALHMKLLTDIT